MKILIVSTRYLGDSLLAASLAQPIKDFDPSAKVDVLTFHSNRSILQDVPGVDNLILVDQRPSKSSQAKHLCSLWNKYDWAVITQQSTRACLYGYFAARKQTVLSIDRSSKGYWKRLLLSHQVDGIYGHLLDSNAYLLSPILGFTPHVRPQTPKPTRLPQTLQKALEDKKYLVFHTQSRYCDKNWSIDGWRNLLRESLKLGYKVAFTGGKGESERLYIESVIRDFPKVSVFNLAGELTFNQTTELIRNAKVYVGVDTATSHLAAATGTACVCLFGPTDVTVWGPSPLNREGCYSAKKAVQTLGNVTIVRNEQYLQCFQCSRHRCPLHSDPSLGHCLQTLPYDIVWNAVSAYL